VIIDLTDVAYQEADLNNVTDSIISEHITLEIPLPSVGYANSYIDLITDYLHASYIAEKLAKEFNCGHIKKIWKNAHNPVYHLTITNFEKRSLAKEILQSIWAFQHPEDAEDESPYINMCVDIGEYEFDLPSISLKYPEIVDEYYANLICGAYYELEFDTISGQLDHFPERWYGYWQSPHFNSKAHKVLVSAHCWIIPNSIKLEDAFKEFDYKEPPSLLNSNTLAINSNFIAVSEGAAVSLPLPRIIQAISCINKINQNKNEYSEIDYSNICNSKVFVSEFLDFIIVDTGTYTIVSFDSKKLRHNEAKKFIAAAEQLSSSFEDKLLSTSSIALDWSLFDDEKFEELCYDLIYHNSKFDRNTIRKMGKSRSRDGGRDIEVYTKEKPGVKPLKYIFQCKLTKPNNSMGISNIGSISDVIDHYGADGYGVICNCYIDSSLYDRLDGISKNRNKEIDTWSKFEVERFIARRPLLKARYIVKKK